MTAQALDLPRIERILREAVAAVQARGFTISPNLFIDEGSRCCPIGALWIDHGEEDDSYVDVAFRFLGVGFNVRAFAYGFDGVQSLAHLSEHELGARLRREWAPT